MRFSLTAALLAGACLIGLIVGGCSAGSPSQSPAPPTSVAPASAAARTVVVTFESGGEHYRVELVESDDIARARTLLENGSGPAIPNGRIKRGETGVNAGYSWSIDPLDIEFADITTEVCDGVPKDVGLASWSSDRFCPWTARVVAVDP